MNELDERRLAQTLRRLGEEPNARQIAREIVRRRRSAPIETTGELVDAIEAALPAAVRRRFGGGHPAKRVFQAIRIAVNDELDALDRALPLAWALLRPGGRLAAISFHSLEDRRVKRFLADRARGCICPPDFPVCACGRVPEAELLTRRAVAPTPGEVADNPRSKSGRLRIARKLEARRRADGPRRRSAQPPRAAPAGRQRPRARPRRGQPPARRAVPPSRRDAPRAPRKGRPRRLFRPGPEPAARASPRGAAALPVLRSPFARTARAGGGRVLDALLAGRGWIALVFVLLAGIVFFNVDLLQLNREIAAGAERASELKRSNAAPAPRAGEARLERAHPARGGRGRLRAPAARRRALPDRRRRATRSGP